MCLIHTSVPLGFLKILRALRALRPLRVISRNAGLKTVVRTLFASIPQLGHTLVITLLIFIIFGILGMYSPALFGALG